MEYRIATYRLETNSRYAFIFEYSKMTISTSLFYFFENILELSTF